MGDKKIYVIAKVFDKQGCLAYQFKTINEARCLPGVLEALRAIQNYNLYPICPERF